MTMFKASTSKTDGTADLGIWNTLSLLFLNSIFVHGSTRLEPPVMLQILQLNIPQ